MAEKTEATRFETDREVAVFREMPEAVLLDVRTAEEYAEGHIPGSLNLPLGTLKKAPAVIPGRDTPLFVYCRSGNRSGKAVAELNAMGYTKAKNIGGVLDFTGELER